MTETILATIASVPFAAAVTALLRRAFPRIDGPYVAIPVLVCTLAAALLGYYADAIPQVVWVCLGPAVAAVMAMGGVQTLNNAGAKATVKVISVTPTDTP